MEDRRSKDNKIFGRMWKTVKTEVGKIRIAETKEKREEIRKRREKRREREKEGRK